MWKYLNIHYAHIIKFIDIKKLGNEWISGPGKKVSLEEMVIDYPRHFRLHLQEMQELIDQ